jgi:hypothetical protein
MPYYTLSEASELLDLDYDIKDLNIPLIKKGCELMKISYRGGGVFIVKRNDNLSEEALSAKNIIEKNFGNYDNLIVVSIKLEKNHPGYSYYNAICINSSDIMDLKKALKVHKLKAFI